MPQIVQKSGNGATLTLTNYAAQICRVSRVE